MRRLTTIATAFLLLVIGFCLGLTVRLSPQAASAQGTCQTFPQTGKTVCGRFLQYWQQNGGLAQQGLPLSSEFQEVSDLNGKTYTVQYFERAVFEKHPENAAPYDVLLSQLGTFQFKRKYPNGDPAVIPPATATPQPTPTQAAPPPAPTPIPDIHTQTLEFPGENRSRFRGTVTEVQETHTIPPWAGTAPPPARGKYVVVFMQVTNLGLASASTGHEGLKLRDLAGRTFDVVDDFEVYYDAAKNWGGALYNDNLQPGVPTRMIFIFDIPAGDTPYYLAPSG